MAEKRQSVAEIVKDHWKTYGRNYYSRHDYENLDVNIANDLMNSLRPRGPALAWRRFGSRELSLCDDFMYIDPVTDEVSRNQGIRLLFDDGARIIFRLSGTSTEKATLRIYLERYESEAARHEQKIGKALAELNAIALDIGEVADRTGRSVASLVT